MPTRLLKTIDLVAGVKTRNLKIPDMKLVVIVEIDAELQKLIDAGKESLRWQHLVDAADAYVKPAMKLIQEDLGKLDNVVATLPDRERVNRIKEVQSVLRQVAAGQEAGVTNAVDKEWAAAMHRSQTLSKYKQKCVTKAIVGAIALSASVASLIASGGGSLLSVMGIFKAVGELAILAADIAQSVDEAAGELDLALEKTRKFIDKEAGTSRTREVLSDLSSILGKAMTSIKTADQNQQKFEAKLAALEKSLDNLVGSLNAGLDKLMKIKTEETKKKEFIKEVAKENKYLKSTRNLNLQSAI